MPEISGGQGSQLVGSEAVKEAFAGLLRFKWLYILLIVFWGSLELLDRAMLFFERKRQCADFFLIASGCILLLATAIIIVFLISKWLVQSKP